MKCADCSFDNAPTAKFCEECGHPLERICSTCGQAVSPSAKFCRACGASLVGALASTSPGRLASLQQAAPNSLQQKILSSRSQMEGERKLVSVLFTDIVGSTALAERLDPEDWGEIVSGAHQRVSEAIYRYEGTIAQLLGDGVLAFFGAPVAHEDDAERAVRAAQDIQAAIIQYEQELRTKKGIAQFQMRIGLNTGLVVVGNIGSDLHMEYLAIGDTVNLSARLQSAAEPTSIFISASTARLVRHAFDLEPCGQLQLKGKEEAVTAFRVIARKAIPEPARGIEGLSSPLVGREAEYQTLQSRIGELAKGHGQVVAVMGEAGIGKSRLVTELRRWALEGEAAKGSLGMQWLEGRCLSFASTTPFAPFIDLLGQAFDLTADEPDADKYAKIKERTREIGQEAVQESAPFLASMLGIQPTGEDAERIKYLEPPQLRDKVFQATSLCIEQMARMKPLVLVFEDLHWVDPTSLELIERLMALTDRVPLMILALFRPQRQESSWHFHEIASRDYDHRYTHVTLEPLDEQRSRILVGNLLRIEDLSERVRSLILKKAEGNPFFVEEVIRSLLDARLVVRENSHWRATREIEDITIPDTLAGVITARLDRLDDKAKRVAQTAAVVGREFPFGVLSEVSDASSALDEALVNLQRRELVREKVRVPELVYIFKHALTQEAAYSSLLLSRRRELHRRVAECLERVAPERVNEIARHLLEAQEQARALPYLVQAGERALFASSTVEAIAFLRKAVDILQAVRDLPLARRAYASLGGALAYSFDIPGAVATFHTMIHEADTYGDLPMKVSALNKLGRITAMMQGQFPEAEEHLREAERLAILSQDLPGLAELHMNYCAIRTVSGDIDGALDHQRRALLLGDKPNMTEARLFGASHCANSLTFFTRFDEAFPQATAALAAAEEAGNRRYIAEPLTFAIPWFHLRMGDFQAAQQAAQRGTELAAQIGAADSEGTGAFLLGHMARLQGRYEEAMAWQRRAINSSRISGMIFTEAAAVCALGSLYLEISEKNLAQGADFQAQALKLMEHPFGLVFGAQTWTDIGMGALARSQTDRAAELFQKALTEKTTLRYLMRPAALVGSALVALARKNLDEARNFAEEARSFAEERAMKPYYPLVELAEGQISAAQGDVERALGSFERAEALASEMSMRPMAWEAREGAASVLAAMGRQSDADAKRSQARAMIDEIAGLFTDEKLRVTFAERASAKLG